MVPAPTGAGASRAMMVTRSTVTVVIARFEDIVGRGLRSLIEDEDSLQLVEFDVPHDRLMDTLDL